MKRQRGWCLLEVMVVLFTGAAIVGTAAMLVAQQQRTNRAMGAYGQGLRELRVVLAEMGDDVRSGSSLRDAGWKLVDHRLWRGDRLRATHVAAFEAERDGPLTTIRVSPMSRVAGATDEATATLTLRVASRGGV